MTRTARAAAIVAGACIVAAAPRAVAAAADPVAHYAGILPCADCPALRMDLTLHRDASGAPTTYEQKMTYVDRRGNDEVMTSAGHWQVVRGSAADPRATLYRLTEARSRQSELVLVDGERALRIVDDNGRDIPSPRPQVLWRVDPAAKRVTLGNADAGRTITLKPGEELAVRLAGNRTTGYQWTMTEDAGAVIAMSATPAYETNAYPKGMVGVGGVETWRLFAFRPGRQRVAFEYRRPWEQNVAPAETISFSIDVSER